MANRLPDDARIYASATLNGALAVMPLKKRMEALDCFDFYHEQLGRVGEQGKPLDVAYTIHLKIDEHVDAMLATSRHAKDVTCRKGCAACCHTYVGIFPHEARLLREVAAEAGIEIDEARLARQAEKTEATWLELSPEDRRCVFLGDDRACQVYEHRPNACRKYLVKSEPELCDVDKYRGGDVTVVYSLEAEIVHSAAMTVFGRGSDSMAVSLLAVKEGDQS
jgi:Fe-S-cluster containining protein